MPYQIDWENSGVLRTYFGDLSEAERRRSLEQVFGDRRFDDLRYVITDFLAVTRLSESARSTLELAALNIGPLKTNPRLVLAAVATDPRHVDYIERVKGHGLITGPYETFASLAEARIWVQDVTGVPVRAQVVKAPGA